MSFEKPHHDVERGTLQVPSFMTPSEKFLLFRDASFGGFTLDGLVPFG
jgi:hypothetical protein